MRPNEHMIGVNTRTRSLVARLAALSIVVLLSAAAVFAFLPAPTARFITDLYPVVLAALCTWLSYQIYRSLGRGQAALRIWALLTAAFGSWTIGEAAWLINVHLLQIETYPFWDDLFYTAGNLLLIAFFALQIRFLRLALQGWRRLLAIAMILAFVIGTTVMIIAPMLAEPSKDWLELGIDLKYEIEYTIFLIGATVLTLAVYDGILGVGWTVIASGLWLLALSDQIFFYARWHDLYFPNGQTTELSIAFNLLYIAAYLVIFSGLYLRWALPLPTIRVEDVLASVPPIRPRETWVILSDVGGKALFVDPRLVQIMEVSSIGQLVGEFVREILGLQTCVDEEILHEAQTRGYSDPRKIMLAGQLYALQAIMEEEPDPTVYWLLTPWDARPDIRPDERPSPEILLARAARGTVQTPSPAELTSAYLQALFGVLSLICAQFGGKEVGQQFAQQFGPGWATCQEALRADRFERAEICRNLLQQALEYVLLIVPADHVKGALEQLEAGLGEEIVQAAAASSLRLSL